MIRFNSIVEVINDVLIVQLPLNASSSLPSRGQVSVRGIINGHEFTQVIEPDGRGGHWLKLSDHMQKELGIKPGDTIDAQVEPTPSWPEPNVPDDLSAALVAAPPDVQALWQTITPMARWEWVRWVNSTNMPETRDRRVEVSISKMSGGKRRPCCFNLSSCTDPELAKSGKLSGS